MSKPPCSRSATLPLPAHHFVILFEGAWIFTPDESGTNIIATCPINDEMHDSSFGIWNNDCHSLDDVPGFCDQEVSLGDSFTITVSNILNPVANFSTLFSQAATRYPFVYIPGVATRPKIDADSSSRKVTIPIPSELRAAGALTTAEVGGADTDNLFGGEVVIKRAFVDFIFIYEYADCLSAQVCRKRAGVEQCGSIHSPYSVSNTNPHLIFDVFPTCEGMAMMYPGCSDVDETTGAAGNPDKSAQKLHVATTFDLLRRSLPLIMPVSTPCCDISLYHSQDEMAFDCGDVGLSEYELGLIRDHKIQPEDAKLPSCGGGAISGGG